MPAPSPLSMPARSPHRAPPWRTAHLALVVAAVATAACDSPAATDGGGIFDPGTTGLSGGSTNTSQGGTTGDGPVASPAGTGLDAALDANNPRPEAGAGTTGGTTGATAGLDSGTLDASPVDADADAMTAGDTGVPEGGEDQVLLRGEVGIEGLFRDLGHRDDPVDTGGMKSVPVEQVYGGVDQAVAGAEGG